MTLAKSFHKGSKAKGTEGKNRGKAVVVLVANCTVEITAVRPYPISIMGMFNDLRMKESALLSLPLPLLEKSTDGGVTMLETVAGAMKSTV